MNRCVFEPQCILQNISVFDHMNKDLDALILYTNWKIIQLAERCKQAILGFIDSDIENGKSIEITYATSWSSLRAFL